MGVRRGHVGTSVPYLVLALAQNHSRCLSFRGHLTRTHTFPRAGSLWSLLRDWPREAFRGCFNAQHP